VTQALLRSLALAATTLLPLPAGAQNADPPTLMVRAPAAPTDARARQERLLRRMEEADYLMRHICTRCGGVERPGDTAPFEPLARLSPAR
jgi:hypothetical protein